MRAEKFIPRVTLTGDDLSDGKRTLYWHDARGVEQSLDIYAEDIASPFTFRKAALIAAAMGMRTCGEVDKYIEYNADVILGTGKSMKLAEYRADATMVAKRHGYGAYGPEYRIWETASIYTIFISEIYPNSELMNAANGILPGAALAMQRVLNAGQQADMIQKVGCSKNALGKCAFPECYSFLMGTLEQCPDEAKKMRQSSGSFQDYQEQRHGSAIAAAPRAERSTENIVKTATMKAEDTVQTGLCGPRQEPSKSTQGLAARLKERRRGRCDS